VRRSTGLFLGSIALFAACTAGPPRPSSGDGSGPPARLVPTAPHQALHVAGELRGAFPGVGPSVQLEAWLRADGRARVDLRSKDDDDRPTHEILLWGPESCLLFEAHTGRFTDLGAEDGQLEALGNAFDLRDAVFLLCGRDPTWPRVPETEFVGTEHRFRGVRGSGILRRADDEAGLRWQDDNGVIRYITVRYEDYLETAWGPWPVGLEITGTDLETAARLQWTRVDPIVVLGDSIFDPLWEPVLR
jgi:hypothetical protein